MFQIAVHNNVFLGSVLSEQPLIGSVVCEQYISVLCEVGKELTYFSPRSYTRHHVKKGNKKKYPPKTAAVM